MEGVVGMIIAIFGMTFNLLSLFKLSKQHGSRSFYNLMSFLALWDFGYLVFNQILFALPTWIDGFEDDMKPYLIPYMSPLAQICLCGSCFTTVAMTVER